MGLSAQDRQALDVIEGRLADSDPRLASMLATFSRLTAEEEMPASESIRPAHRRNRRLHRLSHRVRREGRGTPGRVHNSRRWRRMALAIWLAITLALLGAALAAIHAGGGVCRARRPACASQVPATHLKGGRISAVAVIHPLGRTASDATMLLSRSPTATS